MNKKKLIKRQKKSIKTLIKWVEKLGNEVSDLQGALEEETTGKNVAEATLDLVRYQIRELDNVLGEKEERIGILEQQRDGLENIVVRMSLE